MNYEKDGKIQLCCDRIEDRETMKAVYFAIRMMRGGTRPNIANARAAKYYGVKTSEVAKYTAQHAARIGSSRMARRKEFEREDEA